MYSKIFVTTLASVLILASCEEDTIIQEEETPIENNQGVNETPETENEAPENKEETPNENPEEEKEMVPVNEDEVDDRPSNNIGGEIVVRNGRTQFTIGASAIGPRQNFSFTTGDGVPDFIPNFTRATVDIDLPNFRSQWAVFANLEGTIISIVDSTDELMAIDFDTLIPATKTDVFRVFNIVYEDGILENFEVGQSVRDLRASEANKAAISRNQLRLLVNLN